MKNELTKQINSLSENDERLTVIHKLLNPIDFSILNDEDVFHLEISNYRYLFKGKEPFKNKVKVVSVSGSDCSYTSTICYKEDVTRLSKANEEQKELFFKHFPEERDMKTSGVVRVRFDEFMVHFDTGQDTLQFEVYPVTDWEKLGTGEKGMDYIDKENKHDSRDQFEDGKCLKKLEGSFCWRGIWEGRLYFTDDEYWGEEIEELSRLYNDKIVTWCKGFIQKRKGRELVE